MAITTDIGTGVITIPNEDRNTPYLIPTGTAIQVPFFDNEDARLLMSHHGNPSGKWFEITSGTVVAIKNPTYIKCKYACTIALWE